MERVRKSWQFVAFLVALGLSAVLEFCRSIYRLIELNAGFFGPVTFLQNMFYAFEGVLMLVLVSALAVAHPALCLGEAMDGIVGEEVEKRMKGNAMEGLGTAPKNTTVISGEIFEDAHKGSESLGRNRASQEIELSDLAARQPSRR